MGSQLECNQISHKARLLTSHCTVAVGRGKTCVNIKCRDDWIGWSPASQSLPAELCYAHAFDAHQPGKHRRALDCPTPPPITPAIPQRHIQTSCPPEVSSVTSNGSMPHSHSDRPATSPSPPHIQQEPDRALALGVQPADDHDYQHDHDYNAETDFTSEEADNQEYASDSVQDVSNSSGANLLPSDADAIDGKQIASKPC